MVNFETYQDQAKQTIQTYPGGDTVQATVPFLGIVGEVGSVISELKKRYRDGENYKQFQENLKEELGDVLWYISTIASQNELSLSSIASFNLDKIQGRFSKHSYSPTDFDADYPPEECFQDEFEVEFRSSSNQIEIIVGGKRIGDPITDNVHEEDGYRFHDIFHFGFVAFLGWSPVIRKLLKIKRKSKPKTDEVEDGARAAITEELISLFIFQHALDHQLYEYSDSVDTELLKNIQKLVRNTEVECCSMKQWEETIIKSYKVFHQLRQENGGRVLVSKKNRKIIFIGKN